MKITPKILFLTILISISIFFILTIPHILLINFGFGFRYPMWLILLCCLISGILSPIVAKSKLFN